MNRKSGRSEFSRAPQELQNGRFRLAVLLLTLAAFVLYLASALLLELHEGTKSFGADSWHYARLAESRLVEQLSKEGDVIRIARLHPLTVMFASGWMNLLSPLAAWIDPKNLLKAFFAAAGAVGVLASVWALAAVTARRYALFGGAIYALSASVWYFSSIEESKILTATLAAFYIAIYLRLRLHWTRRGLLLLTLVLFLACLNEIVAVFLLAIPFMDIFAKSRFEWRAYDWLIAHGLAGPLAFLLMEIFGGLLLGPEEGREWQSHFRLLMHFMNLADYGISNVYQFFLNWIFFSIAAPAPETQYLQIDPYGGYFEPSFSNYFLAPWAAGIILLLCVMVAAVLLPKYRGPVTAYRSLLAGLASYSLVRAGFFFLFNPSEPFLFSASTVLPHLMLVLIPFSVSKFPAKEWLLGIFVALLSFTNALFILNT